jgi:hypothetical protein
MYLHRAAYFLFVGRPRRFVFAKSSSCFSLIDFTICREAPFNEDFGLLPRFADNAAPAAICCFFDVAGIFLKRFSALLRACV